jgi:hypothetical protein
MKGVAVDRIVVNTIIEIGLPAVVWAVWLAAGRIDALRKRFSRGA